MKKAFLLLSQDEQIRKLWEEGSGYTDGLSQEANDLMSKIGEIQNRAAQYGKTMWAAMAERLKEINALPADFDEENYTLSINNGAMFYEKNSEVNKRNVKELLLKKAKDDSDAPEGLENFLNNLFD